MFGQHTSSPTSPLLRLAFYGLALCMALIHAFITFRGLSSADGMEQAQLARELARENQFQTKVIQPYAWAKLLDDRQEPEVRSMPDISQPPLQPLVLAPIFKLMGQHLSYQPGKTGSVYLQDRIIACVGVTGFLLMLLWTHGMARILFNESIASISVLILLFCEPLWNLSVSGSPVALLLPLFALALRLLTAVTVASAEGRGYKLSLLGLGITCALLVMAHWMALWIVFGIIIATALCLPGKRRSAITVAIFPLSALIIWGYWMAQRCGDPLGAAKVLLQAHLLDVDVQTLQRQFSMILPQVTLDELVRKFGRNWREQFGDLYAHMGHVLPAIFFLAAAMHHFRRPDTNALRIGLGIIGLCLLLSMGLVGLSEGVTDDHNLYPVIVPALTVYGVSMMAVLWARMQPSGGLFWMSWGYAVIAVLVSAIPMLTQLPNQLKLGMTFSDRFHPHWPPYVPQRVAVVNRLLEPGEIVFSDAPWFVAWYADVPAIWMPNKRSEFELMRQKLKAQNATVAGVVVTPVSARINYLSDAFTGAYSEWPDLIFRGPMLAFEKDFKPRPDFPYTMVIPLLAQPVGDRENLSLLMTFYTDKPRVVKD